MASDLDRDEAASTLAWAQGRVECTTTTPVHSDIELGSCCPHIAHPQGYDWKTFAIWVTDADYTYSLSKRLLARNCAGAYNLIDYTRRLVIFSRWSGASRQIESKARVLGGGTRFPAVNFRTSKGRENAARGEFQRTVCVCVFFSLEPV